MEYVQTVSRTDLARKTRQVLHYILLRLIPKPNYQMKKLSH